MGVAGKDFGENPDQSQRGEESGFASGDGSRFEKAFCDHETHDDGENEYGFSCMIVTVFFWNGVTGRSRDAAAVGCVGTGNEYRSGHDVIGDVVHETDGLIGCKSGKSEIRKDTDDHQGAGSDSQGQEAEENDNVKNACRHVTGLTDLAEPDGQEVHDTCRDITETTVVRFGQNKRGDTFRHDIGEKTHADNHVQKRQDCPREKPQEFVMSRCNKMFHDSIYLSH